MIATSFVLQGTTLRQEAKQVQPQIDLLLWSASASRSLPPWSLGDTHVLLGDLDQANASLQKLLHSSAADYVLLWGLDIPLPLPDVLVQLIESRADVYHAGLSVGLGTVFRDLNLFRHDWSMINAPDDRSSTSWRLTLDACLIRRSLFQHVGGFDTAFISRAGAGLEFGLRCLKFGAVIEHHPELVVGLGSVSGSIKVSEPPLRDLYVFILRHYRPIWSQYVAIRRALCPWRCVVESRNLLDAITACAATPSLTQSVASFWHTWPVVNLATQPSASVSVIIPTLGRYQYLPDALGSLRRQTIRPLEVIIVDQNPIDQRHSEIYDDYADLNLRVIWQDRQGQSLARNTGLAAARGTYVFLFDDDSIARDDLIEVHLQQVVGQRVQVSTGVSYPPPPSNYELAPDFRYPRLSQTFDTGNSLLPTALARRIGGFDRNYDFGPGTDSDFGTRLYLAGERIVHNPAAIRIHFKAPSGGLRVHGSFKYNTDLGLLKPFPPTTQSYYGLRYLNRQQRREWDFLRFMTSKLPPDLRRNRHLITQAIGIAKFVANLPLLPIKLWLSHAKARVLLNNGVRLESFD
jgi:glycosyltransferase involved in cell wall biosynthesis